MRITVVAAICLCIVGISTGAHAQAAIRKQTNIPAQGLGPALQVLAKDRNLQVVYRSEVIGKLRTSGAAGELTTDEAVTELLKGTGLTFRYLGENAITITPVGSSAEAVSAPSSSTEIPSSAPNTSDKQPQEGKKSVWDSFRLAQVDRGSSSSAASVAAQTDSSGQSRLEEVIVTAQKREERLLEVPVPVATVSGEKLVNTGELRLRDQFESIPGLGVSQSPGAAGAQLISIRGIPPIGNTPTVGIVVDDVPFGSPATFGAGPQIIPDFDPAELERIEILRGPQGTLYGAASMGGQIKYVTIDPSTEAVSGHVQAGLDTIHNGDEPGYSFRGSVNVPLGEMLAVRASAYTRQDPGYIDNPILGIRGINEGHSSGGRIAALFRPLDTVTLRVSALYERHTANGLGDVDKLPGLGYLQQSYLPGLGGNSSELQAYSATLSAKLGVAELTSITGYNIYRRKDPLDFSAGLGASVEKAFGVTGAPSTTNRNTDKVVQEIRLFAPIGQSFEGTVGGFYTHEDTNTYQDIFAADRSTGDVVGQFVHLPYPSTYEEYAGFANLTYHLTDRFEIQGGGRVSTIRQSVSEEFIGPYAPILLGQTSPFIYPLQKASSNPVTFQVTPKFTVSQDLMVYGRVATGYRPGNVNLANPGANVPREFNPDKTYNYELGSKGSFFDHRLVLDASVYYIDWKHIQLALVNPQNNLAYTFNGSDAKSEGVELSLEFRPLNGLTVEGWVVYDEAELSQDFPANSTAYGKDGDALPFTSRWSSHVSLQREFPLWGQTTGYLGAAASYVGDRTGAFRGFTPLRAGLPRQDYPAYCTADLRAGMTYGTWKVDAYLNNVADRQGLIGGGFGSTPAYAFSYILPRTVGVNVSKGF